MKKVLSCDTKNQTTVITNIKQFLNENQDPKAIEKILEKLKGILTNGEIVEYIAVQKKPAINISPDCLALTSKRVIFFRPKNLGLSLEFQDYQWKDVHDCHIKEEIFGSEFTVRSLKGQINKMDYLPKVQARKLYTISQEKEEDQREIRRQREMEERRAGAGNFNLSHAPAAIQQATQTITDDPVATLQKLKTMFDSQLISQSEFESKKAEVLQRM